MINLGDMIVFLATRVHSYTVTSLEDGSFGVALPEVRVIAYEDALLAEDMPRGTYIFTDIERLTLWERMQAAELYRALCDAGCRCLNDPAMVMTRYTLLRTLHHAGVNPFRVWRLDDAIIAGIAGPSSRRGRGWSALTRRLRHRQPAPRFPVFLRTEADHDRPLTDPLPTPDALAAAIGALHRQGVPISGVMMIEYCAEPMQDGVWAKFGTARIGDLVSTDHAVIEDNWCVRSGTTDLATPEMFEWEHRNVVTNAYAAAVAAAFRLGHIEYGRADHATVGGREVIYEINTNPNLLPLAPQTSPIRDETLRVGRTRFADGLRAIDGPTGAAIPVPRSARAERHAYFGNVPAMQFRP
jgi:hypothetical protein